MTDHIAILENKKTPYRPPVFEAIGEETKLTVFYVGAGKGNRQWSTRHTPENYNEKSILCFEVGPLVVPLLFWYQLLRGKFDIVVPTSTSRLLLCSLTTVAVSYITQSQIVVWTERVETVWSKSNRGPLHTRVLRKFWWALQSFLRDLLYNNADDVVAFSGLAAEAAEQQTPHDVPIKTAPQVYPQSKIPEVNCDTYMKSDGYRILYLGQLIERKGVEILIEAVKRTKDPLELIIAGSGPEREKLESKAEGDTRIKFIGYVSESEKASLYTSADLFVLPTKLDPWGLVVNEALYFGIPVVTTEAAGAKMILNDSQIVPPGDPEALQEAIKNDIDSPTDPPQPPRVEQMARPILSVF